MTPQPVLDALFTQVFAGDVRRASLAFDELQEGLRTPWVALHARVESKHQAAPSAAESYLRSQVAPLAA
jgi:hypothetical protein